MFGQGLRRLWSTSTPQTELRLLYSAGVCAGPAKNSIASSVSGAYWLISTGSAGDDGLSSVWLRYTRA